MIVNTLNWWLFSLKVGFRRRYLRSGLLLRKIPMRMNSCFHVPFEPLFKNTGKTTYFGHLFSTVQGSSLRTVVKKFKKDDFQSPFHLCSRILIQDCGEKANFHPFFSNINETLAFGKTTFRPPLRQCSRISAQDGR
jgi:hypothetical protein